MKKLSVMLLLPAPKPMKLLSGRPKVLLLPSPPAKVTEVIFLPAAGTA
ncbi:MAG TPA: hypothetical protein VFE87_02300 [Candidatus Paceibacterota bacterium]|nr:hypothetical protein [Candidatus Paceibacterota bacterium]